MNESGDQCEHSVHDLVGIDQPIPPASLSESPAKADTEIEAMESPSGDAVNGAPFLVANWLVGVGEG